MRLPLFSGLPPQDNSLLLAGGCIRQCPRGQMLFAHGERITHFYVIVSGTIQLFRATLDGHEKTIDVLKAGQTLCESDIMDASCRNHRVNAVPVEDSMVIEFSVTWLKDAAKKA